MSSNSDNIEERLIPFIEGVLNEREQREVKEAIKADSKLAREVEELKEVIGDLRQAFASGIQPHAEDVSVEEVVKMASHDGKMETMPGTSEQKARLFCNDQALEEYRLLRGLSEDMQKTTLPIAEVPPMPDSMLAEIARYKASPKSPKVVEFVPKLAKEPAMRGGFFSFIDRINPKPLMAAAAAFALLSLGIHVYNTPAQSPAIGGDQQVAFSGTTPSATPDTTPITEVATKTDGGVIEPTGVTVFTSGDRDLLKEQAEKLLAQKVRYTVTDDRILVAEKEVAQARAVLWGDEEAAQVAMAEKSSEEKLAQPGYQRAGKRSTPAVKEIPAADQTDEEEVEEFVPPKITVYDHRSGRTQETAKKAVGEKSAEGYLSDDSAPKDPVTSTAKVAKNEGQNLGESSALRRKSASAKDGDEPNWSRPSSEVTEEPADTDGIATGTTTASTAPEAAKLKGASREEREQILKSMAMGQSEQNKARPAAKVRSAPAEQQKQQISRARAPEPYVQNRPSPVANVITTDRIQTDSGLEDKEPKEDAGGAVAVEMAAQKPKPSKAAAPPPARQERTNAAPGAPANDVEAESDSRGDVDLRMAMVLDSQAAVARRHNVVISVESSGGSINVYVRPNKELSKSELDDLRRALRAELGLSASDSIIFR